jgi:hypothetical protein
LSAGQFVVSTREVWQQAPEPAEDPMMPLASPPNERTPVRFAMAGLAA